MHDDNSTLTDSDASASGILHCLRMLAEEAADLRLAGTLRALREAIAVCQTERIDAAAPAAGLLTMGGRSQVH